MLEKFLENRPRVDSEIGEERALQVYVTATIVWHELLYIFSALLASNE